MRLFVGIPVIEPLGSTLAIDAERFLRLHGVAFTRTPKFELRWTKPRDMHITLSFLGEIDSERIAGIERALAPVHHRPFSLEVNAFGTFQRAGILFAAVRASEQLASLAKAVQDAMEQRGIAQEKRPYRPHITLARLGKLQLVESSVPCAVELPPISVTAFHLYRSLPPRERNPGGAHYQILASYPLRS